MHPLLNIATRAARAAGNTIMRALPRVNVIKKFEKGTNDFVTEIDHAVEREIIRLIHSFYPQHGILGEESGRLEGQDKAQDYLWIIDPIDGTTNFMHGVPHFAISIAIQYQGRIEHGVVYDPVRQELFSATRGSGAFLNDHRIRVSSQRQISGALMATGFPAHRPELFEKYFETFKNVSLAGVNIRRAGSAALDLVYLAAGRLDGFWEFGLKPWDIAAGALLIREAGGLISDLDGSETFLETGNVVAGTPKLLKSLLLTLHGGTEKL